MHGWGHRLIATASRASLAPESLVVVHRCGTVQGRVLADERAPELRAPGDQDARGRRVDHAVEAGGAALQVHRRRTRHVDREVLRIRVRDVNLRRPGAAYRAGRVEADRLARIVD